MTNSTTTSPMTLVPSLEAAWRDVDSSFERFCLTAGIGAIEQLLLGEAQRLGWAAQAEDCLGRWAMTLMLINVSTRKLKRAVRLPEGDLPAVMGDGTSKSAASRRFVALSAERMAEWMASDLSKLDLLVIQIDGLHIGNDLVLVAALGIDGEGNKHPLGLIEGATENAAA